jgi:hypothetical protein
MNESTTSKTYHCDQCAVLLTDENHGFFQWRDRCDRCHSRLELDDDLLEIAYVANQFYKSDDQVINLQHDLAVTRLRVQELKKPIEDGGDSRLSLTCGVSCGTLSSVGLTGTRCGALSSMTLRVPLSSVRRR